MVDLKNMDLRDKMIYYDQYFKGYPKEVKIHNGEVINIEFNKFKPVAKEILEYSMEEVKENPNAYGEILLERPAIYLRGRDFWMYLKENYGVSKITSRSVELIVKKYFESLDTSSMETLSHIHKLSLIKHNENYSSKYRFYANENILYEDYLIYMTLRGLNMAIGRMKIIDEMDDSEREIDLRIYGYINEFKIDANDMNLAIHRIGMLIKEEMLYM